MIGNHIGVIEGMIIGS